MAVLMGTITFTKGRGKGGGGEVTATPPRLFCPFCIPTLPHSSLSHPDTLLPSSSTSHTFLPSGLVLQLLEEDDAFCDWWMGVPAEFLQI